MNEDQALNLVRHMIDIGIPREKAINNLEIPTKLSA